MEPIPDTGETSFSVQCGQGYSSENPGAVHRHRDAGNQFLNSERRKPFRLSEYAQSMLSLVSVLIWTGLGVQRWSTLWTNLQTMRHAQATTEKKETKTPTNSWNWGKSEYN